MVSQALVQADLVDRTSVLTRQVAADSPVGGVVAHGHQQHLAASEPGHLSGRSRRCCCLAGDDALLHAVGDVLLSPVALGVGEAGGQVAQGGPLPPFRVTQIRRAKEAGRCSEWRQESPADWQ